MDRDVDDHVRFCPLQSNLGKKLCTEHGAPVDLSTAVLIDGGIVHIESAAILSMFYSMGFLWAMLGCIALSVPTCIRDTAYRMFARHRGEIWKMTKRIMGWGDVILTEYKDRIVGLEDMPKPLPQNWGFGDSSPAETQDDKQEGVPLLDMSEDT